MAHFTDQYADRLNGLLHSALFAHYFYKQEIIEVPELLTAILITYDGVRDDQREIRKNISWEDFLRRMSEIKPDWIDFKREHYERLNPEQVIGGWEGRTIYITRNRQHADRWTPATAHEDITSLLTSAVLLHGKLIQAELEKMRETLPVGIEHFRAYEHMVRVVFNFLFNDELGEGQWQARTEPEDEGVEIRDLIFSNKSNSGFWNDLKGKYHASEIVADAKNKDELTRDDLRQLYCYLKPALGFWGFVVCRSEQPGWVHAYNRTLFKNFSQRRGVLVLCDDDLRRMVQMKNRGRNPSEYLQEKMSNFTRSI